MLSRLDVTSVRLLDRTAAMPNQMKKTRIARPKPMESERLYLEQCKYCLSRSIAMKVHSTFLMQKANTSYSE